MAYRRPATSRDTRTLLEFLVVDGETAGASTPAYNSRSSALLVDPDFLLRVYRDPPVARGTAPAQSYPLSDLEVASRLSFFLWNSIPDDSSWTSPSASNSRSRGARAGGAAHAGRSACDDRPRRQLRRAVAQPASRREVIFHPDIYPDFDDSLLEAFEQETKLFLASTLQENRSVRDLLSANYTFVNERLARHYRIPGIYGSRFRRVTLPNLDQRGGLLGNGAILATTSYPERTSPVLRGKWLLDNILGTPPPPPPPGVGTTLTEPKAGALPPTIRERLDEHRKSPTCARVIR